MGVQYSFVMPSPPPAYDSSSLPRWELSPGDPPPGTCLSGGGGSRGGGGPAGTYPIHREQKNYWRMNNSAHGNVMLSAVNKEDSSLNVNSGSHISPIHNNYNEARHSPSHAK